MQLVEVTHYHTSMASLGKISGPEKCPRECAQTHNGSTQTCHRNKSHAMLTLYDNRNNSVSTMHKCYGGAIDNALKDQ